MAGDEWDNLPDDGIELPSPVRAALHLGTLAREYNSLVKEYKVLLRKAAEKRRDAVKVEARAFITADGAMDMRKWVARYEAADANFEADLAEQEVKGARESMRALEIRMEAGRTMAATAREEFRGLPGTGEGR